VTRKPLVALLALVVVLGAAVVPAGAGIAMDYVVTINPTTGVAGTDVTFTSQDACPNVNTLFAATNAPGDSYAAISLVPEPGETDFVADTLTAGDGSWTLTYPVPANEPVGDITFYAFCLSESFPVADAAASAVPTDYFITASYLPVTFMVTIPPTTTTTTITPTTTTAPPPAPSLLASPVTVTQGGTIAVEASGFKPGSNVVITLESDPVNLGTFVADSAGRIATNVVVPADFPVGLHTLKLTGTDIGGAVLVLSTGITVASRIQVAPTSATTAAPVASSSGTLPRTGSSATEPTLLAGASLVLLGSVALLAARRRRASTSR